MCIYQGTDILGEGMSMDFKGQACLKEVVLLGKCFICCNNYIH